MSGDKRQDIHNSDIPAVCRSCEARHGGICGALSPAQLSELSKHTQRTTAVHDTTLKKDSDGGETYSNILSGVVKLVRLMADGRQQIVGLQFAPDFLGRPFSPEADMLTEAATDVKLCSFPKAVLERFIKEVPEMEHLMHTQHMRELDEARDWMLTLGRKNAQEKVVSFLLLVAKHCDPEREDDDRVEISLPLKRADIADFLGLTIETVSRQLTKLRKDGVIEFVDRRTILVTSLDRLSGLADQETD